MTAPTSRARRTAGAAADVVAMPMRDDEGGEPVQAQPPQLPGDVRLGRAGVDEQRALRRLEQDPVSLADIEKRDAEAGTAATSAAADAPPTSRSRRAGTSAAAVATVGRRRYGGSARSAAVEPDRRRDADDDARDDVCA